MSIRYREYNPEQRYFTVIDPEEIKAHNPLLEAIHLFIEGHVSVEAFSKKVRNEDGGAPAVHPKMMLKILVYSYSNGIYPSREMEDRLRWDPNYIYLGANQRVDHSTICNFILQYGEEIKGIFSRLIYVMANMGYITMDFVAIDGTKVMANVGERFTGDIKEFKERRGRIERKIEEILNHTIDEGIDERYKIRRQNKLNGLRAEKDRIEAFLKEVNGSDWKEEMKIGLTDRDARMVKDGDRKYMGYNCQVGVDENAHIIVAAEVFNDAGDRGLLQPMVKNLREQTGDELKDTEVGFDAGYFSSENLQYCYDGGLEVYPVRKGGVF